MKIDLKWLGRIETALLSSCALVAVGLPSVASAMPSFARQTGWSCATCHTAYPQLTPMGRMFKLLGYTTNNVQAQQKIVAKVGKTTALTLMRLSQFSVFAQADYVNIAGGQKVTSSNNQVEFPKQISLFYAGEITPNIGTFMHITLGDGAMALDDSDIRWAHPWKMAHNSMLITGVVATNTPTEPDVYNTTPDWTSPFSAAGASPGLPGTMIEDAAGANDSIAGLGAYAAYFFGPNKSNWLYAELDEYGNAAGNGNEGTISPVSDASGAAAALNGTAPYWRLAYQHDWGNWNWEVGTFGMDSKVAENQDKALSDTFNDYAFDSQLQWLDLVDNNNLTIRATWIHEHQAFANGSTISSVSSGHLQTVNLSATYWYHDHYGVDGGYQSASGTANAALYGTDYSANGSPSTSDQWLEASYMPWWNTRFSIRYTVFNKYYGLTSSTNGGPKASDFNTLELLSWIAF